MNRVSLNAPLDPATGAEDSTTTLRQIVTAIRSLNGSELLGQERELRSRRNRNGRLVIEVIDRETGEILGELPPGEVIHMAAGLQRDQEKEET